MEVIALRQCFDEIFVAYQRLVETGKLDLDLPFISVDWFLLKIDSQNFDFASAFFLFCFVFFCLKADGNERTENSTD